MGAKLRLGAICFIFASFASIRAFALPWHDDFENARGGYWRARIPIRIATDTATAIDGIPIVLKVGKQVNELPLVGQPAEAVRLCTLEGEELLFLITDQSGLPRASGALKKGDRLSFKTSCQARAETNCLIYFDNPLACEPYDFLSIREGVTNGGAEVLSAGQPQGWTRAHEDSQHVVSISEESPHSGKHCFKTTVARGAPPTWVKWMQEGILIRPGATYVLTGWVKARNLRGKAGWYIHVNGKQPMLINQVIAIEEPNFQWRRVDFKFTAPAEASNATVGTVLYGTGTAWFDDAELKLLDDPLSSKIRISIGEAETLILNSPEKSEEWHVPGATDQGQWQWRASVTIRNFNKQDSLSQLLLVDAAPLLARLHTRRGTGSLRIVDPARQSPRTLPVLRFDNRIGFIADIPAMSENKFYVYASEAPDTGGTLLSYESLVAGSGNLVRNGNMDKGTDKPEHWICDEEPARLPPRCVGRRIPTGGVNNGPYLRLDVSPEASNQWTGWRQYSIPVQSNATYLYAGYLRSQGVKEARLHGHIHDKDGKLLRENMFFNTNPSVAGTSDWTFTSSIVKMPAEARSVALHLTMLSDGRIEHDEILFHPVLITQLGQIEKRPPKHGDSSASTLQCWQENALVKVFRWSAPPAGKSDALKASLARNEMESLQVVLRANRPLKNVKVEVSAIKGPDGKALPAPEISLVGYVPIDYPTSYYNSRKPEWFRKRPTAPPTSDGWADDWPDPLPPAKTFNLEPETNQPLWLLISAPKDMNAGIYEGRLKVSSPDLAGQDVILPLTVTVWDFELPDRNSLKVIYDYRPYYDELFGARIDDDYYRKWYRFMARHRICPDRIYPSISIGYDNGTPIIKSAEYDRMAAFCFDELRMNVTYSPHEFYRGGWAFLPTPFLGMGPDSPEYEKALVSCYRAYIVHMKKKGWYDRVVMYISDEPHCHSNETITANLAHSCDLIRKADPDAKIYASTWQRFNGLIGHLNVWGAGPHGSFKVEEMREQKEMGDTIWFTTDGHMCIDTPYLAIERLLPHLCWKYGVECYEFWGINWYTHNPWERGWHKYIFQSDTGNATDGYWVRYPNGDGYLVYPGWPIGVDGPVSSIRLEQAREGIEDYEYFVILERLLKEAHKRGIAADDARKALETASALVRIPNAGGVPFWRFDAGS